MAKNEYNEATVLKRLVNIQKIHDFIKNNNATHKFSNKDKIAYILWQDICARNSDIYLSIKFYKQFFPDFVKNNIIKLNDLYKMPKMYDIQRTRAEIQNTEGLFPAKDEIKNLRTKREAEFCKYYSDKKRKTFKVFPDYFLYFDESGKTNDYFVLAGMLLNSKSDNSNLKSKLKDLVKQLNQKHNLNIKELKFNEIKTRNLEFYKDFIDLLFADKPPIIFISILVNNKGLKQKTEKNKTNELLKLILGDELASIIVRATCGSPNASTKAKLNITLDKDGCGYDSIERANIEQELNSKLKQLYKYLIKLESFIDIDSKDEIFIQLADLYAGAINNIFSKVKEDSETAKCKKIFAKYLLEKIGFSKITETHSKKDSNIKFINKFINN